MSQQKNSGVLSRDDIALIRNMCGDNLNKFFIAHKEELCMSMKTFYRIMQGEMSMLYNIHTLEVFCKSKGMEKRKQAYINLAYIQNLYNLMDNVLNVQTLDDALAANTALINFYRQKRGPLIAVLDSIREV